jgi:hypothetical protein
MDELLLLLLLIIIFDADDETAAAGPPDDDDAPVMATGPPDDEPARDLICKFSLLLLYDEVEEEDLAEELLLLKDLIKVPDEE